MRLFQYLLSAIAATCLLGPLPARSDEGAGVESLSESLEDELLEGLGDDLIEESPPHDKKSKPSTATAPAGEDIGEAGEDDHPLAKIGARMRTAERWMAERDSLKQAPEMQEKIVRDLDALIQQIKKQQSEQQASNSQQSKGGSQRSKVQPQKQQTPSPGRTSNRPARDSTERLGPDDVQRVDMAEMQALLKDLWGHLPERTREQMLQSSVDEFLPEYEVMIEKYFRRLAEEPTREEDRP